MSDERYGFGGAGIGDQGAPGGLWFTPERVNVGSNALVQLSIEELRTLRSLIDPALEEEPVARAITFGTGQEEGFESHLAVMVGECVRLERLDGTLRSVVIVVSGVDAAHERIVRVVDYESDAGTRAAADPSHFVGGRDVIPFAAIRSVHVS